MADVFSTENMRALLDGKYILFFGDSNMRALYKDTITLYEKNKLIGENALKKKLERSFEGDSLLHSVGLIKGRDFKEHRCFVSKETQFEYFFITKCLSSDVTETLESIKNGTRRVPDVIFMNSTLWDVTRWGFDSVALFKKNLTKLVTLLKKCLPEETLVIWHTTPPLSNVRGAFLLPEVEFINYTIRFEAMEANTFAHGLFTSNGYDVIDFHYHLRLNVLSRNKDGVHWQSKAVRYMTNLLLTHISIAWQRPLPGRVSSLQLDELQANLEGLCKAASLSNFLNDERKSPSIEAENGRGEVPMPRIAVKDRLGEVVVNPPAPQSRRRNRRRPQQREAGNRYFQYDLRSQTTSRGRGGLWQQYPGHRNGNARYAPYARITTPWLYP